VAYLLRRDTGHSTLVDRVRTTKERFSPMTALSLSPLLLVCLLAADGDSTLVGRIRAARECFLPMFVPPLSLHLLQSTESKPPELTCFLLILGCTTLACSLSLAIQDSETQISCNETRKNDLRQYEFGRANVVKPILKMQNPSIHFTTSDSLRLLLRENKGKRLCVCNVFDFLRIVCRFYEKILLFLYEWNDMNDLNE
jgi:hypothetical protein